MPPKAPQKSKEAKLLAAQSASKGKGKKKWSKGKLREKKNHRVVFNAALLDKFLKEVPKKMKVVTVYNLIEQYKINGSLARRGIRELLGRNLITAMQVNATGGVFTGVAADGKTKDKPDKADKSDKADKGDKVDKSDKADKGKTVGGGVKREKGKKPQAKDAAPAKKSKDKDEAPEAEADNDE